MVFVENPDVPPFKYDVTLGGKLDEDQYSTILDDIALSLLDIWMANSSEEEFFEMFNEVGRQLFIIDKES